MGTKNDRKIFVGHRVVVADHFDLLRRRALTLKPGIVSEEDDARSRIVPGPPLEVRQVGTDGRRQTILGPKKSTALASP